MALNISYFGNADPATRQCYGINVSRVDYTVTGSSASVGTLPTNAAYARLKAGETCIVSNNGSAASVTNGVKLDAGDIIDIECKSGTNLQAITA
jgi:hypothetical protein